MIYLEDLQELVTKLVEDEKKVNEYLDSFRMTDYVIIDFIIENKYSSIISLQKDFVLTKYLGEELLEWVYWFVYDRPFHTPEAPNVFINGVGYTVTDIDSFMDFARHGLCIPMRPVGETV